MTLLAPKYWRSRTYVVKDDQRVVLRMVAALCGYRCARGKHGNFSMGVGSKKRG